MVTFKHLSSVLAIGTALAASSNSEAEVITYAFTSKVDYIFEHNASTGVNTAVASTTFAGGPFSLGTTVSGMFSYNSDAPLSPHYQPDPGATGTYLIYTPDPTVSKLAFQLGSGPVRFNSGSTGTAQPLLQVANDSATFSGWDTFDFSATKEYDPVMFQSASLALFDKTGLAFTSGSVPTELSLSSFHYRRLEGGWLRRADGDQMHFWGELQTLTRVSAVPEVSPAMMLAFGLGLLWFFGRAQSRNKGYAALPR